MDYAFWRESAAVLTRRNGNVGLKEDLPGENCFAMMIRRSRDFHHVA
jgi:hypothetical protein